MSGLKKNKQNGIKLQQKKGFLASFSLVYFLLIALLLYMLLTVPATIQKLNLEKVADINAQITEIMGNSTKINQQQWDELVAAEPIDIIILDEKGFAYKSMPLALDQMKDINHFMNEEALTQQKVYVEHDKNGKAYTINLFVYKLGSEKYIKTLFIRITWVITLAFLLLLGFILYTQRKMFVPLRNLRKLIYNLTNFDFDANRDSEATDILTTSLSHFSSTMQDKVDDFGEQYTHLELELQRKNEHNVYKQQLVSSLVHDLKTPINISMLQLERLKADLPDDQKQALIATIEEENAQIIEEINSTLHIMHDDENEVLRKDTFDIIKILRSTISLLNPIFTKRDITYEVDIPRSLFVYMDIIEAKQIIHNALSNMAYYTDEHGDAIIEVDQKRDNVILRFSNDASVADIDFERVFDLFYHVNEVEASIQNSGSGVGMYTVKKMVENNEGTIIFEKHGDMVVLEINLPVLNKEGE